MSRCQRSAHRSPIPGGRPQISQCARLDDILFSAVLTLNGVSTFLGPAAHSIPLDHRAELREFRRVYCDARRVHSDDPWLTRVELMDMMAELCHQYREAFDGERVFELDFDTGGDTLEPIQLRWTVEAPFGVAFEGLRQLSVHAGDKEAMELENGPDGEPHASITWYHHSPSANEDDWRMIGFLDLAEGCLSASVPTRALANRLVGEITARLGERATLIETRPSVPVRIRSVETADARALRRNKTDGSWLLGRLIRRRSQST